MVESAAPSRITVIEGSEKIAAGEVVEGPASVVKELLENALDAGATSVTVTVKSGGRTLVQVTDDGAGIHPDDVELAFQKHTSSKLRSFDDVWRLRTLGFRGEALASIATVAKVELVTRAAGHEDAVRVRVEGGRLVERSTAARERGTTVTVSHLFYNTPARRKFMGSEAVEAGRVSDVVTRYSLARPDVHFRLFSDGVLVLNSPRTDDQRQAVAHVYGAKVARSMVPVDYRDATFHVSVRGLAALPKVSRASSKDSSIFVNGRFVRAKTLHNAVMRAYRNRLMKHKFPLVVLHVEVDPSVVDVNVHPAKTVVRLVNEQRVFNAVFLAVTRALRSASDIPGEVTPTSLEQFAVGGGGDDPPARATGVSPAPPPPGTPNSQAPAPRPTLPAPESTDPPPGAEQVPKEAAPLFEFLESEGGATGEVAGGRERRAFLKTPKLPPLRPLNEVGQFLGTYLLLEGPDALYVLDQHAASERVWFERLRRASAGKRATTQLLVGPVRIEASPARAPVLADSLDVLKRHGFLIEHFGGRTFVVRGVPVAFAKLEGAASWEEVLRATVDELVEMAASTSVEDLNEAICKYLACHDSVRAGEALDAKALRNLLSELGRCDDPFHCCHGRPTIIKITKEELETRFKRRV
ncbi:MAG: DNA mismatch repair endonuclease MutL [Promethearchaeota archaeon]